MDSVTFGQSFGTARISTAEDGAVMPMVPDQPVECIGAGDDHVGFTVFDAGKPVFVRISRELLASLAKL